MNKSDGPRPRGQIVSAGKSEQNANLLMFLLVLCAPLFVGLAGVLFSGLLPVEPASLEQAIVGYGALLLGFFSGARLGFLLLPGGHGNRGFWPVLGAPALGLLALLVPFTIAVALLIVGFGAQGAWDSWSGFSGKLPKAYAAMRRTVTWVICLTLMAILILHGMANA